MELLLHLNVCPGDHLFGLAEHFSDSVTLHLEGLQTRFLL